MPRQIITDAEYELMEILWETNEPIGLGELLKMLPQKSWTRNTVATFLVRLGEKGVIGIEKRGKKNLYYPLLKKEEYCHGETKSFLKRLYDGSVRNLVASLYERKEISESELSELRKILETENDDE